MTPDSSEKKIAYGNLVVNARRIPSDTSVKPEGHSEILRILSRTADLKPSATMGDFLRYHSAASESSARACGLITTRRFNRNRRPPGLPIPTVRCFPVNRGVREAVAGARALTPQKSEGALEPPELSPRFQLPAAAAPERSACGSRRYLSHANCTPQGFGLRFLPTAPSSHPPPSSSPPRDPSTPAAGWLSCGRGRRTL